MAACLTSLCGHFGGLRLLVRLDKPALNSRSGAKAGPTLTGALLDSPSFFFRGAVLGYYRQAYLF